MRTKRPSACLLTMIGYMMPPFDRIERFGFSGIRASRVVVPSAPGEVERQGDLVVGGLADEVLQEATDAGVRPVEFHLIDRQQREFPGQWSPSARPSRCYANQLLASGASGKPGDLRRCARFTLSVRLSSSSPAAHGIEAEVRTEGEIRLDAARVGYGQRAAYDTGARASSWATVSRGVVRVPGHLGPDR
jgi:hypothetical protein